MTNYGQTFPWIIKLYLVKGDASMLPARFLHRGSEGAGEMVPIGGGGRVPCATRVKLHGREPMLRVVDVVLDLLLGGHGNARAFTVCLALMQRLFPISKKYYTIKLKLGVMVWYVVTNLPLVFRVYM
jgi:hypothetical protein